MSAGMRTFHERTLVHPILPALTNDAVLGSAWIRLLNATTFVAIVTVGVTDVGVSAVVLEADDAAGSNPVAVTDAAIVPILATGDGVIATIQVDIAKFSKPYAQLAITAAAGVAGANIGGVVLLDQRHMPPVQPVTYTQHVAVLG